MVSMRNNHQTKAKQQYGFRFRGHSKLKISDFLLFLTFSPQPNRTLLTSQTTKQKKKRKHTQSQLKSKNIFRGTKKKVLTRRVRLDGAEEIGVPEIPVILTDLHFLHLFIHGRRRTRIRFQNPLSFETTPKRSEKSIDVLLKKTRRRRVLWLVGVSRVRVGIYIILYGVGSVIAKKRKLGIWNVQVGQRKPQRRFPRNLII